MNSKKIVFKRKDLLGIEELSREEIELILDTARGFKEVSIRPIKKVPALRGKTVVNLFYEPSTRTRISFELASKRLSADVINIASSASSVVKGESLTDTARNIQAMEVDAVVVRHPVEGAAFLLSRVLKASVVNAGDGSHEHPTQALLDMFTIREKKKKIEGLNVVIIGDILHSRVARSNIWGLTKMGAVVKVVGPPTLIPPRAQDLKVQVFYRPEEAFIDADVIMGLRIQLERQTSNFFPSIHEYVKDFCITPERLKLAKSDCLVMHPGPINRGIEISSSVADGACSVILEQVTNGIAVRMAVLYLLLAQKQI